MTSTEPAMVSESSPVSPAMASPFSLEEKQILLETISLNERKKKLEEILSTYAVDDFSNKTIQ